MTSFKAIEDAVFALLKERKGNATICPSEVARRLAPKQWKTLMQSVREVAAQLALEGRLVVTQKGKEVNALSACGPIRLKSVHSIVGQGTSKATDHMEGVIGSIPIRSTKLHDILKG